jgi:hypothetical protein
MTNANFKLKGQYRVRVFGQNDVLKSDSDFTDNLITNSGVIFPFNIAFADCFRYLSLGSGTAAANYSDVSLQSGITRFSYLGAFKAIETFGGAPFQANQQITIPDDTSYNPEGCGYYLAPDSVQLFRTWRIPTGADGVTRDYTGISGIKELMVSPSAPIEMGISSSGGADLIPFTVKTGYTGAFSKLNISFDLAQGDYALITYKLSIYPSTGVATYSFPFAQSNVQSSPINGRYPCTGWFGTISGIYGIVHPGIKLISDINGPSYSPKPAELDVSKNYYVTASPLGGQNYFGVSYTPAAGAPLEPSICLRYGNNQASYYAAYSSNDNSQFAVRGDGNPIPSSQTGLYFPFNPTGIISSGIEGYQYLIPASGASYLPSNIRTSSSSLIYPAPNNITNQFTPSIDNVFSLLFGSNGSPNPGSDNQYVTLSFIWQSSQTQFQDFISSLVLAYQDPKNTPNGSNNKYYPFFDMLFNTIDGRCVPSVYTVGHPATGKFDSFPDSTGVKLFLDGIHNIDLSFRLGWSR